MTEQGCGADMGRRGESRCGLGFSSFSPIATKLGNTAVHSTKKLSSRWGTAVLFMSGSRGCTAFSRQSRASNQVSSVSEGRADRRAARSCCVVFTTVRSQETAGSSLEVSCSVRSLRERGVLLQGSRPPRAVVLGHIHFSKTRGMMCHHTHTYTHIHKHMPTHTRTSVCMHTNFRLLRE